ncbi:MAG: hypothetical protein SGJ09_15015 [Phycisphaerae bacterium]|nr:hypothetical protein [Phycisphaerae bacterium]
MQISDRQRLQRSSVIASWASWLRPLGCSRRACGRLLCTVALLGASATAIAIPQIGTPAGSPVTPPAAAGEIASPNAKPATDAAAAAGSRATANAQAVPARGGRSTQNLTGQVLGGRYVRAMDWELDFRPGALRLLTDTSGKSYWYFTYKVINRTGKDRMWAPRLELFTDKGEILTSGRTVPTDVTRSILQLLGNPLLQDQNQVIGEILIGEEHAKEGLVVWPVDDTEVTEFTVFVSGASGKIRKTADPRTNQPRVERWTIRFNYLVPGDPLARGSKPVEPASTDGDVKDGADRRTDAGVWLWR